MFVCWSSPWGGVWKLVGRRLSVCFRSDQQNHSVGNNWRSDDWVDVCQIYSCHLLRPNGHGAGRDGSSGVDDVSLELLAGWIGS